jgi:hypothetical protein
VEIESMRKSEATTCERKYKYRHYDTCLDSAFVKQKADDFCRDCKDYQEYDLAEWLSVLALDVINMSNAGFDESILATLT